MNYKTMKLTSAKRITIPVNAVVEIEVNEVVEIEPSKGSYGQFFLRKCLAKKGLLQYVHTPFKSGYSGTVLIVVKNDHVSPIEVMVGDELGEVWIYGD